MNITSAEFISSQTDFEKLPAADKPEFAFAGRSNAGKSSLINMLAGRKNLARTSVQPGKTQTINHFLINKKWYLVDLPGYGFAKVSQVQRSHWKRMMETYLRMRKNLFTVFILIDASIPPQKSDLDFLSFLGAEQIPVAVVFTKTDKLTRSKRQAHTRMFHTGMRKSWETLPPWFVTSAQLGTGRKELLLYMENLMQEFPLPPTRPSGLY